MITPGSCQEKLMQSYVPCILDSFRRQQFLEGIYSLLMYASIELASLPNNDFI